MKMCMHVIINTLYKPQNKGILNNINWGLNKEQLSNCILQKINDICIMGSCGYMINRRSKKKLLMIRDIQVYGGERMVKKTSTALDIMALSEYHRRYPRRESRHRLILPHAPTSLCYTLVSLLRIGIGAKQFSVAWVFTDTSRGSFPGIIGR